MKTKFVKKKNRFETSLKLNDNLLWGKYNFEINACGQNKGEAISNLIDTIMCSLDELHQELMEVNDEIVKFMKL